MDALRHQRVKSIFAAVCDCEPSLRAGVLARECGGDVELRREVESLLAHDDVPRVDLESAARNVREIILAAAIDGHADHHQGVTPALERIGDYRILSVLGEGGMGVVYLAEQDNPRRTVALKVIKPGITSTAMLRRFEHEAHVLGKLQHPGIAQIYEAGTAAIDDGVAPRARSHRQPFFAMEYVRGRPLLDHAASLNLGTKQRIELLIKIAHAAHHAHIHGIVHRDLKPSNIIVDSHGQPKVLDFGVARSTDADLQVTTLRTDVGQLIGTIPYMSPEQIGVRGVLPLSGSAGTEARGSRHPGDDDDSQRQAAIDARSDVYALGVISYELLGGRLPHDLRGKSIPEAVRIIGENEPTRLSSINRYFRGDLDTIVSKALEKEPARRYQSAAEFALDLQRYLDDQPIIARPPSAMYQFRKFAKRNKPLVAAATAVFIALLCSLLTISIYLVQATTARDIAMEATDSEKTLREVAERKSREALKQTAEAKQQAYLANIAAAQAALEVNDIHAARRRLDAADPTMRNWEWRFLEAQLDDSISLLVDPDDNGQLHPVYSMALSADERELYAAHWDRLVRRWRVDDGSIIARYEGHQAPVESAVLLRGDSQLVTSDYSGMVIVRSTADGSIVHQFEAHPDAALWSMSLSPDGTKLATIAEEPVGRIWSTSDWSLLLELKGQHGKLRSVRFSPDGTKLATGADDASVSLWDAADGRLLFQIHPRCGAVSEVAFSPAAPNRSSIGGPSDAMGWTPSHRSSGGPPSAAWTPRPAAEPAAPGIGGPSGPRGTRLAITGYDGTVRVWNLEGEPRQELALRGHTHAVRAVAWSSDGTRIASGGYDALVRLWDASDGRPLAVFTGHDDTVNALQWTDDGSRLYSGSIDGSIRSWSTDASLASPFVLMLPREALALGFTNDGEHMLVADQQRTPMLRDAPTGELVCKLPGQCSSISVSRDGRFVAGRSGENFASVWDARTGALLTTLHGHAGFVVDTLFTSDGRFLVTSSFDESIIVWETATWTKARQLGGFSGLQSIAIHPDGDRLAVATTGSLVFVSLTTGEELARIAEGMHLRKAAFSPDGSILATTSTERFARLWDARTGTLLRSLADQDAVLNALAWSPDGSRLVTATVGGTVWFFDTASWQEVAILRAHSMPVIALAFSPDGSRLVTSSRDRTIRLWDTRPLSAQVLAIEERRRLLPELEPAAASLLIEHPGVDAAIDAVERDPSLSDAQRRIMHQLLIRGAAEAAAGENNSAGASME
jgi:WD40 repeat protein/serine/threonine protein kinase